MNCKSGDLAVTTGMFEPMNNDVIVEVLECLGFDLTGAIWHVKHRAPMLIDVGPNKGRLVTHGEIHDSNLRPISGVPLDDETPIETDVAEALRLGLGIESRWRI